MANVNQLSHTRLGQYQIKQLLGKGGMGAVYQAYQPSLDRDVAVKVLIGEFVEDPQFVQRFTQEAKIIAALEHPNIITVHDYGVENDISYVVMRLLTGGTLEMRLLQKGKFSPKEALRLLTPLADALDYAHQRGILHRDIKPSNIMFDEQNRPYLVDFGLAKLTNQNFSLTNTGFMLGTPNYMSPEQWKGETLTPATDQYAFAAITYEILTGKMPFAADSTHALMHKHLMEEPPHTVGDTKLPTAVYVVLLQGMAKNPKDRYPSVKAFMKALAHALGEATSHKPNTSAQKNRSRLIYAGVGIIGTGILIMMIIGAMQIRDMQNQPSLPTPTNIINNTFGMILAKRAYEEGNYRIALVRYNEVISQNPQAYWLYYERALVLYALHRRNDALDDLDSAIEYYPAYADAYLLRAKILRDMHRYQEAQDSINQYLALEASPVPEALEIKSTLEALNGM